MHFDEHLGVLEPCGAIVRCDLDDGGEQQLRIVEHLARHADAREQPHGFDLSGVLQQIRAHHGLGIIQIAIQEQAGRGDHRRRNSPQRGHLVGGPLCLGRPARHPVKPLEHAPARRQRVIEDDCLLERLDRGLRLAQRHEAMAAFLIKTAEARVTLLETCQRLERVGRTPEIAQRDGLEQQRVA